MTTARSCLVSHTRLSDLRDTLINDVAPGKGIGLDGIRPSNVPHPLDLEWQRVCHLVQKRMRSGSYSYTPYREVLVPRGRDHYPRVISIPTVRDRLALKVLSQVLYDLYGVSGPAVAQRMVGRLSSECPAWSGFVRIDLEDYFGSIDHGLLMKQLRTSVQSPALLRLISAAIQNPTVPAGDKTNRAPAVRGIPQGLSISSALAEIYLSDLDAAWTQDTSAKYFRYVDDIVILCGHDEIQMVADRLCDQLRDRGLTPHAIGPSSKSSIGTMAEGFDFLGYRLSCGGTSISRRGMRKIENQIAATFGEFRRRSARGDAGVLTWLNWKVSRLACGVIFDGEHRGWLKFYSRTNDISGLHHLDALVAKLAERSGVPSGIRFKKFVRAYHVTRSGHAFSKYIPNPANWSPEIARKHLAEVDGWEEAKVERLQPRELFAAVNRVLSRDVVDLERDLDTRS